MLTLCYAGEPRMDEVVSVEVVHGLYKLDNPIIMPAIAPLTLLLKHSRIGTIKQTWPV